MKRLKIFLGLKVKEIYKMLKNIIRLPFGLIKACVVDDLNYVEMSNYPGMLVASSLVLSALGLAMSIVLVGVGTSYLIYVITYPNVEFFTLYESMWDVSFAMGVLVLGAVILVGLIWHIVKKFISWIKDNWEEAGRIAKEEL